MGGGLEIPTNSGQPGEGAIIAQIIGHVVAVCGCPAKTVLLFSLGPTKVIYPVCGTSRGIRRFRYDVVDGPDGPIAEIDIQLDEPLVKLKSPIVGGFGGQFQS